MKKLGIKLFVTEVIGIGMTLLSLITMLDFAARRTMYINFDISIFAYEGPVYIVVVLILSIIVLLISIIVTIGAAYELMKLAIYHKL